MFASVVLPHEDLSVVRAWLARLKPGRAGSEMEIGQR